MLDTLNVHLTVPEQAFRWAFGKWFLMRTLRAVTPTYDYRALVCISARF